MKAIITLLILVIIYWTQLSYAQPSNDACINAITLIPNEICTNGQVATANADTYPTSCHNVRTVWYKFVAIQTQHYVYVKIVSTGSLDVGFGVYSGTSCTSLSQITCKNDNGVGIDESVYLNSLTIGNTYYIRVSGIAVGTGAGAFCISVRSAPSNDDCSNAITLIPNGNAILGTNILATNDGTTTCLNPQRSVWYQFTATHTTHRIELDILTDHNLGFRLFQGSCGSLSTVLSTCSEENGGTGVDEAYTYTNLTVGQNYYIMISSAPSLTHEGWFYIKVIAPPTNDSYTNATTLTINADCTYGNNHLATPDGTSNCLNTSKTVWYKFTATHTNHFVELIPAGHSRFHMGNMGFTCYTSALTQIACVNTQTNSWESESVWLTNLVVGNTYYISVSGNTASDRADFCIRVAAPPSNDFCNDARTIQVNMPGIFGTNEFATTDGPAGCGSNSRSVWYKFTATKTNHLVIVHPLTNSPNNTNLALSVYSGTCSSLTLISCADSYSNAKGEMANVTGLTVGNTYYIRVAGSTSSDQTLFSIAVMNNNDFCANRNYIEVNKGWVLGGLYGMNGESITFCGSNAASNNTVWFSFIATSSTLTVEVEPDAGNPGGTGNQRGLDVEFRVYHNPNGCSITSVACKDDAGFGQTEVITLNSLTVGDTYLIAVDGEAHTPVSIGTFRIRVTAVPPCGSNPPPGNTCSTAPLISNLNGYCGVTSVNYNPNMHNNLNNESFVFCTPHPTTTIDNNSFLMFIANDIIATFDWAITSNAPNGGPPCNQGIQIQVFEVIGSNCETGIWKPISSCPDPTGGVGSSGSITVANLIPGKAYYIMFDGFAGNECGYRISVPENSGIVLPVEFLSFRAKREKSFNHLMWKTAQEANLAYFEIQWSHNGSEFESIARVPARNAASSYNYNHIISDFGYHYYRLKIVYKNGSQEFSPAESIHIKPDNGFQVEFYPIPFQQKATLRCFVDEKQTSFMQIFTTEGSIVYEKVLSLEMGDNEFEIELSHLSKGMYILRLSTSEQQKSIRIVKTDQ